MNLFYVVGMYQDGPSLLTPKGKTLADALHSIWWQYQPRRGCEGVAWYICQPLRDEPGVMIGRRVHLQTVAPTGSALRLDIADRAFPQTREAHAETLAAIWPECVEYAETVLQIAGKALTKYESALAAAEARGDAHAVDVFRQCVEAADERESAAHEAYRAALAEAEERI